MRKNWPEISWKIIRDKLQKYESNLLKLNSNKAKKFLRWESKLQFNETIKLTTNWYKNFNNKKINIYDFSKNQIIGYIKK